MPDNKNTESITKGEFIEDKRKEEFRKKSVPRAIYNVLSIIGFFLVLVGVLGEIFLFLISVFSTESGGYQGIFIMLFFLVIILGLLFIIFGYWLENQRRKSGKEPSFSEQTLLHHPLLIISSAIVLVAAFTIIIGVGSYKVYHVTESTEFCGQLCHSVMNPEWVTYHNSTHARVKCVECHIGDGADWFVRSKLSGLRQIYAVLADDFSRPIPTPIKHLRPARETCEKCHWPKKFIGYKEKVISYYHSDEENTEHKIRLLIKIGGEEETSIMKGSGIHYHMLSSTVEYMARDEGRQEIAWVRVERPDKSVTEYQNSEVPLNDEKKENLEIRTMDCLDCHNRPSHKFKTPMDLVNASIKRGSISVLVPQIKLQAVNALDTEYETTEKAMTGIGNSLRTFYDENYPGFIKDNPKTWLSSIQEIQAIYQKSIFPEMKAQWKSYPDNIGHRDWPGCFRCHNENMQSPEGKPLYTSCNDCHLILAQGKNINQSNVDFEKGMPFDHPGNDEIIDEYTDCNDCHDGGKAVYE
jgi:hypothetical protein